MALTVDGIYFFGSETCGQHNFQHLNVRAVAQFAVADAGRLVHAGARLQAYGALALVLEFNPALEDVDKLKFSVVQMRLAGKFLPCRRCCPLSPLNPAKALAQGVVCETFHESPHARFGAVWPLRFAA